MALRRPQTIDEILSLAAGFSNAQQTLKIRPEASIRFGLIMAILFAFNLSLPRVISGFRTLSQQANLRTVRGSDGRFLNPARRSQHTVGLAFDLDQRSPSLQVFAQLWRALGGRAGADFKSPDPGHFDFPVPGIEPQPAF